MLSISKNINSSKNLIPANVVRKYKELVINKAKY